MEYTRVLSYQFPLTRGEDVRAVQQALMALHIQPPCGDADGVYGYMSASAVKSFQGQFNAVGRAGESPLTVDGKVGQQTWAALFNRAVAVNATAARIQSAAQSLAVSGPASGSSIKPAPCLTSEQVRTVRNWMSSHYLADITAATAGSPFDANLVYAIACQETAAAWLPWISTMTPDQVLARCVFDASGDASGSSREAFPANTAAFRSKYGDALTQQLIDAANQTRGLRKLPPAQWVYKGYGIFQYDLQNIVNDPDFFNNQQWSDFRSCLDRLMRELNEKLAAAGGDVQDAIRRYNGAGPAAELYAVNVIQMRDWSAAAAGPALA
jgi:peptidoglycan hydrolase-like protein with peptidoglycan-binding domain